MTLSPQQRRLYEFMRTTGVDVDVAIVTLHFTLNVQSSRNMVTKRVMQQIVGSAISRTNKKIKEFGCAIVPGNLKNTYRLTTVK